MAYSTSAELLTEAQSLHKSDPRRAETLYKLILDPTSTGTMISLSLRDWLSVFLEGTSTQTHEQGDPH